MGRRRDLKAGDERITYAEAAEILNCGVSNIPKLIRAGYLSVGEVKRRPALERAQVEQLAADRAHRAAEREAARNSSPEPPSDRRPDAEHDWLTCGQAAELIGITTQAMAKRLRKGKMPGEWSSGQWWVRAEHAQVAANAKVSATAREVLVVSADLAVRRPLVRR